MPILPMKNKYYKHPIITRKFLYLCVCFYKYNLSKLAAPWSS